LLYTLEGHSGEVNSIAWSPDGRILASVSDDHTIRLWDVQTGQLLHILEGHNAIIFSVAWSPDGEALASSSGSRDKTIRLWDRQTGQPLRTLEGHTGPINSLSFSWDSRLLASKSQDDTVRIWRTDRWEEVAKLKEIGSSEGYWPPGLAFHPSASVLATLGEKD